jgi:hypothetical protein
MLDFHHPNKDLTSDTNMTRLVRACIKPRCMHGRVLQLTTHSPVCHAFVGNVMIVCLVRPVIVLSLGLHGLVFFVDVEYCAIL